MIGTIAGIMVDCGVHKVMKYAVKAITPGNVSKITKVLMSLGVAGVSAVIGAAVEDQVDEMVDQIKTANPNVTITYSKEIQEEGAE